MSILRAMGQNRELVLKDDDLAIATYRRIADSKTNTGGADYFTGVQGAARMLTRRGEYEDAFDVLNLIDIENVAEAGGVRCDCLIARHLRPPVAASKRFSGIVKWWLMRKRYSRIGSVPKKQLQP